MKGWKRVALPFFSAVAMGLGWGVRPGSASPTIPAWADVLPAETTAVFWINTTAEAWAKLDQFGLFPEDALRPKSLTWILGFDYEATFQPWLGSRVAIALLPEIKTVSLPQPDPESPSSDSASSDRPTASEGLPPPPKETLEIDLGVVVVMPTTDDQAASAFVDQLKARAPEGEPVRETIHKGITILEWQTVPIGRGANNLDNGPQNLNPGQIPTQFLEMAADPEASPSPAVEPSDGKAPEPTASPSPGMESPTAPEPMAEPDSPSGEIPDPTEPTTADPDLPEEAPVRFAIVRLPGYVVAARTARPLMDLIDAQVATETLSRRQAFERTAKHPQAEDALLMFYSDVPQLYRLASAFNRKFLEKFPDGPKYLTHPEIEAYILDNYQTLQGLIWVEPDGVHGQSSLYFTRLMPEGPKTPEDLPIYIRSSNSLFDRLPVNTYVARSGQNFANFWQATVNEIRRDPQNRKNFDEFRQELQRQFGLDDRDIFSWMDGEFALFSYPTKTGFFPTELGKAWTLGLGVMVQTSDRAQAEAALLKLEQGLIKISNGGLELNTRQVDAFEFRSLSNLKNGQLVSILARSWVAEDTMVVTTGEGPLADLVPRPYQLLADGFTFQEGIEPLPENNSGYFYVNLSSSLSFIYQAIILENLRRAERIKGRVGQNYMGSMTRAQQAYYLENGRFATRFEDLQLGIGPETSQYRLQIVRRDRSRVYMVAQAKQADLPSFSAAVVIGRGSTLLTGVCETIEFSQTPPSVPQVRNTANGTEVRCPAGAAIAGQVERVPPNRPPAIPPELAEIQRRLGVMRSVAATTSLTPEQIQGDIFLRLAAPRND